MKRTILCIALMLFALSAGAAGPTYFYVITTVDINGLESGFSNQTSVTYPQQYNSTTCPTQPGACIGAITWTAASVPSGGAAIQGYNVYRSATSGGPYSKINAQLVTGGTSYNDPFVYPNAPTGAAGTVK